MQKLSNRLAQHLVVGTFFASIFLWLTYVTGQPSYIYNYGIDVVYEKLNPISIAVIIVIIVTLLASLGTLVSQINNVVYYLWNASAFNKEIKNHKWLTDFLEANALEYQGKISDINILVRYLDPFVSAINILKEYKTKNFVKEFKKWRKERRKYKCNLKGMGTSVRKHHRLRTYHESTVYFFMSYIHTEKDMNTSFIDNEFWLLDVKSSINPSLIIVLTVYAIMPFISAIFAKSTLTVVQVILAVSWSLFFLPVILSYQAMVYQRFCRILLSTMYVVVHRNELWLVGNQKA